MKRFLAYALTLELIAGFTASALAAPIDDLIKGAKQEGTIEFYAPSTLTPQGAQALGAAFNKKYGLNVKLQYSPSGNMTRDIGKVVGLGASGVPPEWDLMVVTDAHHATLWVKKMHQPFDYKSIGVDAKAVQYDNGSVSFANQFVLPAYNKQLVQAKDAPKSWDELLQPKWKGEILFDESSLEEVMALLAVWGKEKTVNYFTKLSQQQLLIRVGRDTTTQMMMAGEAPLAITTYAYNNEGLRAQNAPVDWIAEDLIPALLYPLTMARNAPHPHSAALFYDYLISEEGQRLIAKEGRVVAHPKVEPIYPRMKELQGFLGTPRVQLNTLEQSHKFYKEGIQILDEIVLKRKSS